MKVRLYRDKTAWVSDCESALGKQRNETTESYFCHAMQELRVVPVWPVPRLNAHCLICPECGAPNSLPANKWTVAGTPDNITITPSVWCPCSPTSTGPDGVVAVRWRNHFVVTDGLYRRIEAAFAQGGGKGG